MLYTFASVTNGPVSPADATYKTAKSDEMNKIPNKEVPAGPDWNERVAAFVALRFRHAARHKPRNAKSPARRSLNHRRYVKAQVMAARSEAVWTPRTTE